jgi:hypothetical protein
MLLKPLLTLRVYFEEVALISATARTLLAVAVSRNRERHAQLLGTSEPGFVQLKK